MSEQENKPTAAQRKAAETNRNAAMRQRDLLQKLLDAKRKIAQIKREHYRPGSDFKVQLEYQKQDDFWKASQEVDDVNDQLGIIEHEGQIAQLNDRIKVYTETLGERG